MRSVTLFLSNDTSPAILKDSQGDHLEVDQFERLLIELGSTSSFLLAYNFMLSRILASVKSLVSNGVAFRFI